MDMKISSSMTNYGVQKADSRQPEQAERISRAEERTDMFTISSRARDFSIASKAMSNTPDVRLDKVESLKAQIGDGTYNVSGMDVVNKLFAQLG